MAAKYNSFQDHGRGPFVPPMGRHVGKQADPFYESDLSGSPSSTGAARGSAGGKDGDRQQDFRAPYVASMPPTAAAAVAAAVAARKAAAEPAHRSAAMSVQAPVIAPVRAQPKAAANVPAKTSINVWGSESPEAVPATGGSSKTDSGDSSAWVVADESSKVGDNGRMIHETKLVQRGRLARESVAATGESRGRAEAQPYQPYQQYPQHPQYQLPQRHDMPEPQRRQQQRQKLQQIPVTPPPRKTTARPKQVSEVPQVPQVPQVPKHVLQKPAPQPAAVAENRAPTPTPPDKPAHAAARARHIARWVLDMRQRQAARAENGGDDEADVGGGGSGGRAGVHGVGGDGGGVDDGATEVTSDRLQWPTLLRDPAVNNNSLPATEPTGALHRLRMRILTNFAAHCRADHEAEAEAGTSASEPHIDGGDPDDGRRATRPACRLCAPADAFTMRPQHGRLFLDGVLLPLSEAISYADVVLHVNTSVVERVFADAGLGESHSTAPPPSPWDSIRAMPIYEDYQRALVLATHRRRVFDELPLALDGCGMVTKEGKK